MHTAADGVAVVTTTLARTDRRALSQAWYSALHLADGSPPPRARTARPAAAFPAGAESLHRAASGAPPSAMNAAHSRLPIRRADDARPPGVAVERRGSANGLGRRIACVFARRPAAPPQAATIDVRGGRVHVVVRAHGATTRIIAVCPPSLEARVAQALAHARFGLAAAGVRTEIAS